MDQIAKIVKQYVDKRGKSQSEVARRLGISSQLLGQYISGRHKPKADFYTSWKKVFGDDLLKEIEGNVSSDPLSIEAKPEPGHLQVALKELSEATNRHSKIDEVNAKNMERLLNILEKVYGIERRPEQPVMDLPEPGGEMVVDIRERSKRNQLKK